jgi:hypothetical protein
VRSDQLALLFFRVVPALTLASAFVGICIVAGTAWPWTHVVHEDGRRTLLDTLFFFEHATRELAPDLVLALGVAGAVRYFFPPAWHSGRDTAVSARTRLLIVASVVAAAMITGTVYEGGMSALSDNLSQMHTRAGAPLVWGAHWRYHLIERLAQILLAFCVAGILWMQDGRPDVRSTPGRTRLFAGSLALFVALTLLFELTMEPFREPTFLGHQARELFTHTLVTLPLALGTCFSLARRFAPHGRSRSDESIIPIVLAGALSVLSGLFLLVGSVLTGAQEHGQTTSLAGLLFPHFAEHALGYVLVPALAGALYLGRPSSR